MDGSANVGGLEIAAKIAEHGELKNFMRSAAAIKPDVFIDVGEQDGARHNRFFMRMQVYSPRLAEFVVRAVEAAPDFVAPA
jgi:hypothetical protein